jgi:hypothetical protein
MPSRPATCPLCGRTAPIERLYTHLQMRHRKSALCRVVLDETVSTQTDDLACDADRGVEEHGSEASGPDRADRLVEI